MWLSAALDPVFVFAAGVVWPSAGLLWRILCESWCTYQRGCRATPLGQAWFAGTKETTSWAASGFMPWVLSAGRGNRVESCLVAYNSWCWGGTVVRTEKEAGSVRSLKSPFIFLLPHQLLLHLCRVTPMQQEPWPQEKWVLAAPSSSAASQPVLGSAMAGGRITKLNESPEKFSIPPARVSGNEHERSAFAKRYWLFSSVQYLSLPTNSIFLLVTSNNWSDTEIRLAWVLSFPVFTQSAL